MLVGVKLSHIKNKLRDIDGLPIAKTISVMSPISQGLRFLNNQDPQILQEVVSASQFRRKRWLKKSGRIAKAKLSLPQFSTVVHNTGLPIQRAAHRQ